MTYEAQTFGDRIVAGDKNALAEAIIVCQRQWFDGEVTTRALASNTHSFTMEFDDHSYLSVKRLAGETESVRWGVIGQQVIRTKAVFR